MKKRTLLIILSAVLCLMGGTTATAQNNHKTEKVLVGDKAISIDRTLFPDFNLEPVHQTDNPVYQRFKARQRAGVKVQLPDHVNNGEDKYFSPILFA